MPRGNELSWSRKNLLWGPVTQMWVYDLNRWWATQNLAGTGSCKPLKGKRRNGNDRAQGRTASRNSDGLVCQGLQIKERYSQCRRPRREQASQPLHVSLLPICHSRNFHQRLPLDTSTSSQLTWTPRKYCLQNRAEGGERQKNRTRSKGLAWERHEFHKNLDFFFFMVYGSRVFWVAINNRE